MRLILLFCIFVSGRILAQDSALVYVRITDTRSGDPIQNVELKINMNDSIFELQTHREGIVQFQAPAGASLDFELSHFKFSPNSQKRKVPIKLLAGDTLDFDFTMDFIRIQDLETMEVAAPGVPVVVFDSEKLHVSDFEILNNGELLLLTYPKQLKKGSQMLLFDGIDIKANLEVEDVAEELVRDFRGNPHVVCADNVFGLAIKKDHIERATLEKDYFFQYVMPILDTNKAKLYFSNFNALYPAFDYFSFDRVDSAYTKILEIKDDLMMELYRSEYKWMDVRTKLWAKTKEMETGIDAEVWVGMNYFTQSIYYKALYAPLFHRNDSLFVFDYYKDRLRIFDADGHPLDSIAIYHHYDKRHTGWDSQLIQDRVTGQIYALYNRAGYMYLGWVDTKTGEINQHVQLEYRYAQNIQVFNNEVFYIYRPFESAQKKYLYKERLPYDFGAASMREGELVEME